MDLFDEILFEGLSFRIARAGLMPSTAEFATCAVLISEAELTIASAAAPYRKIVSFPWGVLSRLDDTLDGFGVNIGPSTQLTITSTSASRARTLLGTVRARLRPGQPHSQPSSSIASGTASRAVYELAESMRRSSLHPEGRGASRAFASSWRNEASSTTFVSQPIAASCSAPATDYELRTLASLPGVALSLRDSAHLYESP